MRLIVILATAITANSAYAGAWLREEGTGFVATSVLHGAEGQNDTNLYAEYGLRPKLTLGVKIDASMVAGQIGSGSAYAFARKPLPTGERPFKMAYELGVGATLGNETDPLLRTGLSYGRGLQWGETYGWLAMDLAVEWSQGGTANTAKLDTTLGLTLTDATKVMMQVFFSDTGSDSSLTLAPSLIWQPKPERPSYQIGLETERGEISLRLGLWRDF